ncbi:hypothetical protein [Nocardia mangyaensis]|uniref:hypothetical protein n=1 Tax=Nocardia mangyaensis TaxID=2213200 RepID=UPI0014301C74|nr:hypothetical protein [Nocardia mangyaensis]
MRATEQNTTDEPTERADLVAWRRRHALRSSAAATAVPSGRAYRRSAKHRDRRFDS